MVGCCSVQVDHRQVDCCADLRFRRHSTLLPVFPVTPQRLIRCALQWLLFVSYFQRAALPMTGSRQTTRIRKRSWRKQKQIPRLDATKMPWLNIFGITKTRLQLRPSLTGVRLSFALMNWLELGEAYPPALEKMKQVRDETEKRIRDEDNVRIRFEDFHDFVALNRTLREEHRTAELFQWVDERDEEDAQRVFDVARPALIKQGEFELCGKYIESEQEMSRIDRNYILGLKMAEDRFGEQHRQYVEKKFLNDVTTLAALLVKNGRIDEATDVATKAQKLVKDPQLLEKLSKQLEPAMLGTVPKPWP